MSDGEIEVETVSGYQVLPKDVVAEIGSVKLFSMPTSPAIDRPSFPRKQD